MYQDCTFVSPGGESYCGCYGTSAPVTTDSSSDVPPANEDYCVVRMRAQVLGTGRPRRRGRCVQRDVVNSAFEALKVVCVCMQS